MIDQKYQGKGLGEKSLIIIINSLKTKKIYISTTNKIALKLYIKIGFTIIINKSTNKLAETKLVFNK